MTIRPRPTVLRPGVTGIVLAGGRSTRFGSNKLEALIDGVRVIDRVVAAVSSVVDEVILAGTSASSPAATSMAIVPDGVLSVADGEVSGGPLVGLRAGLAAATRGLALVVGGDMPLVEPALLRAMVARLASDPGLDSVVLGDGDQVRPLPMAIRVERAREATADGIGSGDRSLRSLLARLSSATMLEMEWRVFDPDGDSLLDIDRPADIELARARRAR